MPAPHDPSVPSWTVPPPSPAPEQPPIDVREQIGPVVVITVEPTPIRVDPRGFPV